MADEPVKAKADFTKTVLMIILAVFTISGYVLAGLQYLGVEERTMTELLLTQHQSTIKCNTEDIKVLDKRMDVVERLQYKIDTSQMRIESKVDKQAELIISLIRSNSEIKSWMMSLDEVDSGKKGAK